MVPDLTEQTIKSEDRQQVFRRPGPLRTRNGAGSADEKDLRPQGGPGALGVAAFLQRHAEGRVRPNQAKSKQKGERDTEPSEHVLGPEPAGGAEGRGRNSQSKDKRPRGACR